MELEVYFKFILSFGLILIAARIGGELAERYLKQPPVLGELVAGIIISPFALGLLISDPIILKDVVVELPPALQALGYHEMKPLEFISQVAVIVLLFVAGVETDVRSFLRYGLTGAAVAVGGVVLPFAFGYLITRAFFPDIGTAGWLFMGAVLTATSIGITVRILMDMGRLATPEGTTILVGAVIDDIIGLVILSVVVSMAEPGAQISIASAVRTGAIGFAVWFGLLMIGVRFGHYISRFLLQPFRRSGTIPIFALIVGLILAYLVTLVDLHPVVGAYVAGLVFAATREKEEIVEHTRPIMLFLAPFFFAYLGMQVDLRMSGLAWLVGVILIVGATLGKIIGCALPAKFVGRLSNSGAMIVGIGMVPRGEVGLIIAGAGFLAGAINRELFAVAVVVSIFTTLITPAMLKPFFRRREMVPSPPR